MAQKTRLELFLELANPDSNGYSRAVSVDEFIGEYSNLKLGNGFSWGRKDSTLDRKYYFDKIKQGNKIVAIKLNGKKNSEFQFNQNIRQDIRNQLKNKPCVILGTVGGSSENMKIQIDHKDGRKNDPRVSDISSQTIDDFQPLCTAANTFKRNICERCEKSGLRWRADILEGFEGFPFYEGTEIYEGTCVGCYLYDPVAYRKAFKQWIIDQVSK